MTLDDERLRQLLQVTWDVAIETTFLGRMKLLARAFSELVRFDGLTAVVFDPATVTPPAGPPTALAPVERPFDVAPERHIYLENYKMAAIEAYATRYMPLDPMTPRLLENLGTPLILSDVVPEQRWSEEPYTREFMPITGFRHALGVAVPVGEGLLMTFGPWRTEKRADFTPEDVRAVKLLQPILARTTLAALLSEKLAATPDPTKRARTGFALFARSGDPIRADAGAQAFLARMASVPHAIDQIAARMLALARGREKDEFVELTFPLGDEAALRVSLTAVGAEGGTVAAIFRELMLGPDAVFGAAAARLGLTMRECEVARRVLDGRGNKEIAAELGLSLETVKSHLKNIFRKAGVESRTELVASLLERKGGSLS